MTNELVKRLRGLRVDGTPVDVTMGQAADEIERLQGEYNAYRADGEPELRAANAEIMRLLCREQQLMEFLRSFISGGVNQDFKPWARELYQKLYSSPEPEAGAPFPYPTDRDGWICSVCHGWNGPKTRVCLHSHVPLDPQGASRDASSTRVTVDCSQCTATVSLPQRDGLVDIEALGLWYFSTPTGWRCPAHAPAQRTSDER